MAARATKQLRAKDRLALPLLYLLHLIFTLSSLILRLYQSIFGSQHEERSTKPIKQPRHVALVLAASSYSSTPDGRKAQQMAWLHSIERVEKLAMEEGVSSLSVWDNHGILRQCRMSRDPDLSFPPPPPRYNSYLDRRTRRRCSDEAEAAEDELNSPLEPVTLVTGPTYTYGSSSSLRRHMLPRNRSKNIISEITKRYARKGIRSEDITQERLDIDIHTCLGFESDPDLLIVHDIAPPSFFRALLPRPPPELQGYPFWSLRITEIYHHPTPLPLPGQVVRFLSSLLSRAQSSSLTLVRKVSRQLPIMDKTGDYEYIPGALSRDEWEGAMTAWSKVEQRLGK